MKATLPGASAAQQKKPRQWEVQVMQPESSPHSLQLCSHEGLEQLKKNKTWWQIAQSAI